ncbi:unnamed protein product [Amoebophrya sp. A25]|nr:unnamed protein product [Amoebophrya sp. A25]|eukprot:GSA25T00019952001.1
MREKNKKMRCFLVASFPACAFAELTNSRRAQEVDASGETIDASDDTPGADSSGDRSRSGHIKEQRGHIGEVRRHVTNKRRRKTNKVDNPFLQLPGWPLPSGEDAEGDASGRSSWVQTHTAGGVGDALVYGSPSIPIAGVYNNSTLTSFGLDNSFLEKMIIYFKANANDPGAASPGSVAGDDASASRNIAGGAGSQPQGKSTHNSLSVTEEGLKAKQTGISGANGGGDKAAPAHTDNIKLPEGISEESLLSVDIREMIKPGILILDRRNIGFSERLWRDVDRPNAPADGAANMEAKSLEDVAKALSIDFGVLVQYIKASSAFVNAVAKTLASSEQEAAGSDVLSTDGGVRKESTSTSTSTSASSDEAPAEQKGTTEHTTTSKADGGQGKNTGIGKDESQLSVDIIFERIRPGILILDRKNDGFVKRANAIADRLKLNNDERETRTSPIPGIALALDIDSSVLVQYIEASSAFISAVQNSPANSEEEAAAGPDRDRASASGPAKAPNAGASGIEIRNAFSGGIFYRGSAEMSLRLRNMNILSLKLFLFLRHGVRTTLVSAKKHEPLADEDLVDTVLNRGDIASVNVPPVDFSTGWISAAYALATAMAKQADTPWNIPVEDDQTALDMGTKVIECLHQTAAQGIEGSTQVGQSMLELRGECRDTGMKIRMSNGRGSKDLVARWTMVRGGSESTEARGPIGSLGIQSSSNKCSKTLGDGATPDSASGSGRATIVEAMSKEFDASSHLNDMIAPKETRNPTRLFFLWSLDMSYNACVMLSQVDVLASDSKVIGWHVHVFDFSDYPKSTQR